MKMKSEMERNRKATDNVSSYFFYMWNRWSHEECEAVYGNISAHIWSKWCAVCKPSAWGAAERLYAELSDGNRQLLVERAVSLYDGRREKEECINI